MNDRRGLTAAGSTASEPELPAAAPAGQTPIRPGTRAPTVVVILALIVLTGAHLRNELRFLTPGTLIGVDGGSPVLQGDPNPPAVDAAFRAAAAHLPASAGCVIGRDAWNRNYFRAAYLLMPRRVWPASPLPRNGPVSSDEPVATGSLAAAVRAHHAACVLVTSDERVPPGFLLRTKGSYSLYTHSAGSLQPTAVGVTLPSGHTLRWWVRRPVLPLSRRSWSASGSVDVRVRRGTP